MGLRKQRLLDSLRVQQLFRDVEDEEAWIREKEPIAASTNRGRDLIGVQNLIKKHQAVLAEMHNHEPHVLAVCQAGYQMADDGHFAADEVRKRIQALADHWAYLKEKALQRKQGHRTHSFSSLITTLQSKLVKILVFKKKIHQNCTVRLKLVKILVFLSQN